MIVVAVAPLGGCLGEGETRGLINDLVGQTSPIPAMEIFGAPLIVGKGGDAETSLTVSKDGQTLLACSHGGFTKPSPVWASTDGGKTFVALNPQPNPIVSGDCDVAITDNGDWYIVYDTIASATVAGSSDKGRTWRFSYVSAVPFGGVDRPWIRASGNALYLVYADVMALEPFIGTFAKSTDGGRTWAEQRIMATTTGPDQLNCVIGHPILKDDGRHIRVPLDCFNAEQNNPPHVLYFATSTNGGTSWMRERVAGPHPAPFRIPVASYAGDGTLYFGYATGTPGKLEIHVLSSRDDAKTWSAPIVLATGQQIDGVLTVWVDGAADGGASVAWLHNTKPTNATGSGQFWQVHAARIRGGEAPALMYVGPVADPVQASQVLEFLMVRHDAEGRANILYPMVGKDCRLQPPGMERFNRNNQCVLLLVEGRASVNATLTVGVTHVP